MIKIVIVNVNLCCLFSGHFSVPRTQQDSQSHSPRNHLQGRFLHILSYSNGVEKYKYWWHMARNRDIRMAALKRAEVRFLKGCLSNPLLLSHPWGPPSEVITLDPICRPHPDTPG